MFLWSDAESADMSGAALTQLTLLYEAAPLLTFQMHVRRVREVLAAGKPSRSMQAPSRGMTHPLVQLSPSQASTECCVSNQVPE